MIEALNLITETEDLKEASPIDRSCSLFPVPWFNVSASDFYSISGHLHLPSMLSCGSSLPRLMSDQSFLKYLDNKYHPKPNSNDANT